MSSAIVWAVTGAIRGARAAHGVRHPQTELGRQAVVDDGMMMHFWCAKGIELPIGGRTARFAVGVPDGQSSNSWAVTTSKSGDVYISGRDNFQGSKSSLHTSGRWRLATTQEAALERPDLVSSGTDRAVAKWS